MKTSMKTVLLLAGTFCSLMIGAATATGQEILQYLTAYGIKGAIGVVVVTMLLGTFIDSTIACIGKQTGDKTGLAAYEVLLGKYFGKAFAWFVPVGLLSLIIVMLSGTGATIEQYFGLDKDIGCAIAVIAIVGCATLGFSRIFSGIGSLGVILMIAVGIFAVVIITTAGDYDFQEKEEFIINSGMPMAASNWLLSGFNYALFGITLGVQIFASLGLKANTKKEIISGMFLGNLLFGAIILLMSLAMELFIEDIYASDIPFLAAITNLSNTAGLLYAALILAAVFTTLTPLVWEALVRIGPEKSKRYYIAAAIVAILGYFGARLPFASMVNIVYPILGYCGIAILLACIVYIVRTKIKASKA